MDRPRIDTILEFPKEASICSYAVVYMELAAVLNVRRSAILSFVLQGRLVVTYRGTSYTQRLALDTVRTMIHFLAFPKLRGDMGSWSPPSQVTRYGSAGPGAAVSPSFFSETPYPFCDRTLRIHY